GHVRKAGSITVRHAVSSDDLVGKYLQLLDQDGSLESVESSGDADPYIIVFIGTLPMDAQASDDVGKMVVVGQDGAAVAEATERLGGKEARCGGAGQRSEAAAFVGSAEALRGIVEHEQLFRSGDRRDGVVIGRLPEQIDRDDRLGREALLLRHRNR